MSDILSRIIDYEDGVLPIEETASMFQRMINTGDIWSLQGSYGRTARDLIDTGWCVLGESPTIDHYGNPVPSRHDVTAGTPGSIEYARQLNGDFVLYDAEVH
jgi:hypothetical protein